MGDDRKLQVVSDSDEPDVDLMNEIRSLGKLTCETFGELMNDFLYQLQNGEYNSLASRLSACVEAYGHVPLPDDDEEADRG